MDYSKMTGPELVKAYNAMVASPAGQQLGGYKAVQKFADVPTGIKRCERLESSIRAIKGFAEGVDKLTSDVKKKTTTPKAKAPKGDANDKLDGAPVRVGSNRDKAIQRLQRKLGEPVTLEALMLAVYGAADADHRAPLMMVLKGIGNVIAAGKLPFTMQKHKDGRDIAFSLHQAP